VRRASAVDTSPGAATPPCLDGTVGQELRHHAALGNHAAVLKVWQGIAGLAEVPQIDLAMVVDAMRKLNRSPADIATELQAGLQRAPALLPSFAALPAALLRDNAIELLDNVLKLLEEQGNPADATVYAGLMSVQLRRRDHTGVAATAAPR